MRSPSVGTDPTNRFTLLRLPLVKVVKRTATPPLENPPPTVLASIVTVGTPRVLLSTTNGPRETTLTWIG